MNWPFLARFGSGLSLLAATQIGCVQPEEADASEDEATLAIDGDYVTTASSTARFRAGYLYELVIEKPSYGGRWSTLYTVSDECSKQRADKTCDRAFVESNPKSLQRTSDRLTLRSGVIRTGRDFINAEGELDYAPLVWKYETTKTGLKLTPKDSNVSFTVDKKVKNVAKIDSKVKADLDAWYADPNEGFDAMHALPEPSLKSAPLSVQREYYFFASFDHEDYAALYLLELKGNQYFIVNEEIEGNGSYEFFDKKGDYLGSLSGTESSAWDHIDYADGTTGLTADELTLDPALLGKFLPATKTDGAEFGEVNVTDPGGTAFINLTGSNQKLSYELTRASSGAFVFTSGDLGGACDSPGCSTISKISGLVYEKKVGATLVPSAKLTVTRQYDHPENPGDPSGAVSETYRFTRK